MEFKIDTKEHYTLIAVETYEHPGIFTAKLTEIITELRQNGSKNYIVNLERLEHLPETALEGLLTLHEEVYGSEQSLVFTQVGKPIMQLLKTNETDLLLNIAPTEQEAIDIINMEILERDLFSEE